MVALDGLTGLPVKYVGSMYRKKRFGNYRFTVFHRNPCRELINLNICNLDLEQREFSH